jgi:hypothetical protein
MRLWMVLCVAAVGCRGLGDSSGTSRADLGVCDQAGVSAVRPADEAAVPGEVSFTTPTLYRTVIPSGAIERRQVVPNEGGGRFGTRLTFDIGGGDFDPSVMAVGDVDGDGRRGRAARVPDWDALTACFYLAISLASSPLACRSRTMSAPPTSLPST